MAKRLFLGSSDIVDNILHDDTQDFRKYLKLGNTGLQLCQKIQCLDVAEEAAKKRQPTSPGSVAVQNGGAAWR